MKIILLSTLISILIISCKNEKKEYLNVIITGNVKGIPATKIYLTDAYNAKNILDSSDYINDKFSFNYVPNKDSRSLLVSLRFFNKNNNMRNTILVRNKFSAKNGSSAFILEKGTTIISGENFGIENNGTTILDIFSGKQNDVFFKLQNKGFGFVTKSDSGTRYKEISYFKSIINKYPYSYYLLQEIVSNKETYTKAELSDIIKLFSTEIQNSSNASKLRYYLSSNDQKINNFSNLSFLSSNGLKLKLIDTSYNINMIVFWASWCAPCRKEIPTIKSIYKRYNDKRLKITNISIDTDTVAWRKTLRLENMPWEQLVTYNLNIDTIKEKFSFSSIPVIILTNYHGTEIYRFSNLTKVEEKKCIEIIDSYLTK